jgi:hypothetical protein
MFTFSTKYSCIISVGIIPRVNLIMTFAFCTGTVTSFYNYMLMYMLTLKFFFAHKRRIRLRVWNTYILNSASQAGVLLYIDFKFLLLCSRIPKFKIPILFSLVFLPASSLLNSRMNEYSLSLKCEIRVLPRAPVTCTVPTTFPYTHSILKRAFSISSAGISEQRL